MAFIKNTKKEIKKSSKKDSPSHIALNEILNIQSTIHHEKIKVKDLLPKAILIFGKLMEDVKEAENFEVENLKILLEIQSIIIYISKTFLEDKDNIVDNKLKDIIRSKLTILGNIYYDFLIWNGEDWDATILDFIRNLEECLSNELLFDKILIKSLKEEFKEEWYSCLVKTFIENSNKKYNLFITFNESYLVSSCLSLVFAFNEVNLKELTKEQKKDFQSFFIKLLDRHFSSFTKNTLKVILKKLNSFIFEMSEQPQAYSDFILNIYSKEKEKDLKILSLSCLFTLVIKYDYIFQEYFETLYSSLFISEITSSIFFNRLLKIIYLSVKPESTPKIVVCAFIKKLIRLGLKSNSTNLIKILDFIEHQLYFHKDCLSLLSRRIEADKSWFMLFDHEKQETQIINNSVPILKNVFLPLLEKDKENENKIEKNKEKNYEKFLDEETDPFKSKASSCCLWEIYSLLNHFNSNVRKRAQRFTKKFIKKDIFLDQLLKTNEEDVLYNLNTSKFYINFDKIDTQIINLV